MCLPIPQVDRFYSLWKPLLNFINERLKVIPSLLDSNADFQLSAQDAAKIRSKLWVNDSLLEAFTAQNPANLNHRDLDIVRSWKYRRHGDFYIFKHLKNFSIFIAAERKSEVFAVKGLYSPFEVVIGPHLPVLVKAVLLPFENDIIYDSLLQPYNIIFGGGIRRDLKSIYDDAKECGDIIGDLMVVKQPNTREEQISKAEATNARVLEAFRKHLYKTGLSPSIVERDVSAVDTLFRKYLIHKPEVHSLRMVELKEVSDYISDLPEEVRRPTITGLKRFFRFLFETGRMEWADDIIDILRNV
jgi:hypothetical protein